MYTFYFQQVNTLGGLVYKLIAAKGYDHHVQRIVLGSTVRESTVRNLAQHSRIVIDPIPSARLNNKSPQVMSYAKGYRAPVRKTEFAYTDQQEDLEVQASVFPSNGKDSDESLYKQFRDHCAEEPPAPSTSTKVPGGFYVQPYTAPEDTQVAERNSIWMEDSLVPVPLPASSTDEDWVAPEPNQALREAAEKYKEFVNFTPVPGPLPPQAPISVRQKLQDELEPIVPTVNDGPYSEPVQKWSQDAMSPYTPGQIAKLKRHLQTEVPPHGTGLDPRDSAKVEQKKIGSELAARWQETERVLVQQMIDSAVSYAQSTWWTRFKDKFRRKPVRVGF